MARPTFKVWLTMPVVVWAMVVCATAGNAEIRRKAAGVPTMKSPAVQAARPKQDADPAAEANSANTSSGANRDDPLADDDSLKGKSGGKNKKDQINKKGKQKGTKEPKPTARKPSGRPRDAGATGGQILVGGDLNLEPET